MYESQSRTRTSLAVQQLGLGASTAGGTGSIPSQGTKFPHAVRYGRKKNLIKKKKLVELDIENGKLYCM